MAYPAAIEENTIARRASYGPSSPAVGERGARTRQALLEAALRCFEEKGFNATLVDDIAGAVGISRAGLYQYFDGKEQLFVELVHESGADLLRVIRRLGPLGPTVEGFDNLHWWLGEWAWVHDKYATVFMQWASVDTPNAPLRPLIAQFIESYASRMSARLADATGDDPDLHTDDVAVTMLALVIRYNFYRHRGINRRLSDEEMLDAFATFWQMALFPSTPPEAFAVRAAAPRPGPAPPARRPPRRVEGTAQPDPSRFGSGSERVLATVRRLLDAGAVVLAARGFHGTAVDEILKESGLGRGTFYKYFSDKLDLLITLAEECAVLLEELAHRFADAVGDVDDPPAALRAWLAELLAFHRRYIGVIRVLTQQEPRHPKLDALGIQLAESILLTSDYVLGRIERDYSFDVRGGSLVLLAMLERVPDYAFGTAYDMPDDRIVEVLATLLERGLLAR